MKSGKSVVVQVIILITIIIFNGCTGSVSGDGMGLNDNKSTDNIQHQDLVQEDHTQNESQEQIDNTEPSRLEETEVYITRDDLEDLDIPENMLEYWLVLNSKIPFISANEGCQEFFWDEYFWCLSEPNLMYTTNHFGLVDLDNDGSEELVMTGFPEMTQILDYQDGKVYGYQFVFRGMARININGVYSSSSGSDIGGFHRIHLDKGSHEEETLAYMDGNYFEVGGVEVPSDEFYEYTASLMETEMMVEMDFTEEMLDKILLGDLEEGELSKIRNMKPEEICDENNPQMVDVPEAYRAVLTGSGEFVCVTEDGEKFLVDGNCVRNSTGEDQYQILYFSSVDMEGDGEDEVVLTCSGENLILHEAEGIIYGYVFDCWAEMNIIANDGVFQIGSRSVDQYGKIVSFNEDGCEIEEVDYNFDINDNRIRYYYFSEELIERYLGI